MTPFIESLRGYKTYIIAVLGIVITGMRAMNYLTQEQYDLIIACLGALGLAAVRDAIEKKA